MHGSGATEGDQRCSPHVGAAFHRVYARGRGHVLVHELVDSAGDVGDARVHGRCDLRHRGLGRGRIEWHLATEEVRRVEHAEQQIGIGDGRLRAAAAVGRRTGLGTGRIRPDLQQSELVDARDAAAARADLHQIDRRDRDRKARSLLEPIHARDLEVVAELRLALLDETRLCGRPAHVETEQAIELQPLRVPGAGERTGGRTGLDHSDRIPRRDLRRHDATVRKHDEQPAAEPLFIEPALELVEIRPDHRHCRGVAGGRDHARVFTDLWRDIARRAHRDIELLREQRGNLVLVAGVGVTMEQTHRDGLDVGRANVVGQAVDRGPGRLLDDDALGGRALLDLERERPRNRRLGELDLQVIHVVPVLVANQQRVGEALVRDERGPGRLALDQRVGDERRRVHDRGADVARRDSSLDERSGHAALHSFERPARRAERLVNDNATGRAVEQDDVRERATDVDGEPPVAPRFGAFSHCDTPRVPG